VTGAADSGGLNGEAAGVEGYEADTTAMDSAATAGYRSDQPEAEPPWPGLPTVAAAGQGALSPLPANPHESAWPAGVQDGGDAGQGEPDAGRPYADQRGAAGRNGSIPPPAEFWQRGEPAGTVELAAVEQSSVVAFRRRQEQSADQWQEQIPAAPPASDRLEAVPSQGAGYYGRRYQGFPPRYQPGPGQQDPPALFGAPTEDAGERSVAGLLGAVVFGADQPADTPSGADEPEALKAGVGQAEDMPGDADRPEAVKAGGGQPAADGLGASELSASELSASELSASEPGASEPDTEGPSASEPDTEGPSASEPGTSGPSASGRSAGRPKTGQSGVRQSTSGQSTAGQSTTARSKSGQSRTGQSRTAQSGGPPKAGQSRAAQSKTAQSRQTSAATSASRATSREAGKRSRG